ncbi:DUF998 domain-containing protein [Haladaptatus sp. DJG-WS-42]|uniref:DUF998 domain-containing protein n=1 Tax=Haladaptatus sp. DJG-WS-42 TaxID=3120516 RepID=UPI0030CFFCDF
MQTARVGGWAGVLAPTLTLGAILLGTLLSPTFTWTESALSNLGAVGAATAWLFNGGLLLGSLVAVPFLVAFFRASEQLLQRIGVVLLSLALVGLFLVGVFPMGTTYHFPAALSFYLFTTVALWIHGSGSVLAGAPRTGLVSIWLGITNIMTWLVWIAQGPLTRGGLAVPEFIGACVFASWMVLASRRLLA